MADSSFNRELFISMAKLAKKAQHYDEMAEIMKKVAKSVRELTADERDLLSEAYKNRICCRRDFWKSLSLEKAEGTKSKLIREYREKVEAEMSDICKDILSILDLPSCKIWDHTSAAFYHQMKGNFYGYLVEFKSDIAKKEEAAEFKSDTTKKEAAANSSKGKNKRVMKDEAFQSNRSSKAIRRLWYVSSSSSSDESSSDSSSSSLSDSSSSSSDVSHRKRRI